MTIHSILKKESKKSILFAEKNLKNGKKSWFNQFEHDWNDISFNCMATPFLEQRKVSSKSFIDGSILFGSFGSEPSHFIFQISVGKKQIRYRTTLNFNDAKFNLFWDARSMIYDSNSRVVQCRIRSFPTLISKIKWLGSGLPLTVTHRTHSVVYDC